MTINLTIDTLKQIIPTNTQPDEWLTALTNNLDNFEINTPERVSAFLAQCGHESADFTKLHENLNYKAASLVATWPRHFDSSNAAQYEHNPEMIGNRAYANRNGNSDEASGDGYKYRGRGPLQITGKANYTACSQIVFSDGRLIDTPELLESDFDAAVKSACWFWNSHKLNTYADQSDIDEISRIINGGNNGLSNRATRYQIAIAILGG